MLVSRLSVEIVCPVPAGLILGSSRRMWNYVILLCGPLVTWNVVSRLPMRVVLRHCSFLHPMNGTLWWFSLTLRRLSRRVVCIRIVRLCNVAFRL